jgi:carboxyl-terminal processing protease
MYVPEKNDAPEDFVRLLPPTRTYGEKDLDATLVSSYAKDTDKPTHEVPFLVERKKPAAGAAAPAPPSPDDEDEDGLDDDEIVEDFEMRFAKEVLAGANLAVANRPRLVSAAARVVAKVRAEEEKKLTAALQTIGVDWSPAPAQAEAANLEVTLTTSPSGTVKAGDLVSVTATVKNHGTGAAWRVLPRLRADDHVFEDTELPIGKVGPGETKTYTAKVKVPKDALDRVDRLGLEVKEARNAPAKIVPSVLQVEAAPRPIFSYAYQLIDEGNGDGLVQRGERYRLQIQLKNTGAGPTQEATVLLRNATGDGVILNKSRHELKDKDSLAPGQVKELEFPLATDATLRSDELIVELMAYDAALDVQSSEKLRFKVQPALPQARAPGEVTVKASAATIRAGASLDATVVGAAMRGASYAALGTYGAYTKVKLTPGGSKVGFIQTEALSAGGSGSGSYQPVWNSTPPVISLSTKALETTADTYKLSGSITDEQKVEDVYVFVSNQQSKIESRKVFYRSNRGGKDLKSMVFSSDLPMWPGSNMVTVVARSNAEVKSVKTMFVYRETPRTAQSSTPAAR